MTGAVRVGLVIHEGRAEAVKAAAGLVAWCRERGMETCAFSAVDVGADRSADPEGAAEGLDVVVSVGGDGTLLRAALVASHTDVPVLGVNVGRLGFLTEIEPQDVPEALEALTAGELEVDERMALTAEPEGTEWDRPQWALNEVMVEKLARHRVISLEARVGEDLVTTFAGDGVIVATPTGSTAYSFSARGPIVAPDASCLVLTPVSPHMVFDRALVLSAEATVTLTVRGEQPGILAADGRGALELPVGSRVVIRRADRPARLLRRKRTESFFTKLRRKFDLPEGPPGAG